MATAERIDKIFVMDGGEEWSDRDYEVIQLSQEAFDDLKENGGNVKVLKEGDEGVPAVTVYVIHHGETWSEAKPVVLYITLEERAELLNNHGWPRHLEDYYDRIQ